MKKAIALFMIILLIPCTFIGCTVKETKKENNTPTQPVVVEAPEKTVSLNDIENFTIKATETWVGSEYTSNTTYAKKTEGNRITYYIKMVLTTETIEDPAVEEYACVVEGGLAYAYVIEDGIYKADEYYALEADTPYEYFSSRFSIFGFDYTDWLETTGFEYVGEGKKADRDCDIYKFIYTFKDRGIESNSEIYVDKETGIWLSEHYKDESSEGTLDVKELAFDSEVIPEFKTEE